MSNIWRVASASAPGKPLAMKIPLLREFDDPAAIVGFEVEAGILPLLTGVHVPRFVASQGLSTEPYIVMEYLSLPSLRARLTDAPLPSGDVAAIGARVATALADIHRQHVIHLDVKPSNVLFRETGEAVLIDFGTSRHRDLPDLLAEELKTPIGTGPYISPEQILRTRDDPRSDLFALGVVLYLLSTGRRPFGNPASVRGLRRRLYRDPSPPRMADPDYPPWLQEIVLRCLEVDPSARYASAEEVAAALRDPRRVALTDRARREVRDPFWTVVARYARSLGEARVPAARVRGKNREPLVVAAIDLAHPSEPLDAAMRAAIGRILQPGARLACVTVLKTHRIGMDALVDKEGRNLHVRRLVELEHWARPLGLPTSRTTYHVLGAPDPGAAILDFASANRAAQILVGSRGSSTLRRYLGSVSSQIVAQADCTVTVVKALEASD
jgi:nucleotide-binding universal stress UspA family protein